MSECRMFATNVCPGLERKASASPGQLSPQVPCLWSGVSYTGLHTLKKVLMQ